MNQFRHIYFLIWFLCGFTFTGKGQQVPTTPAQPAQPTAQKKVFDLLNDDIKDFLPSLDVLIDSAVTKDPHVNFRKKQIDVNSYKLKTDGRQFFRNIGVQADIRYGNFDNWSTNVAEGQSPSTFGTTRTETKYGAGAYIKFPIFDIINHNNSQNMAKMEIAQAEDMYMMQRDELIQKVIIQVNDLILRQKILVIRSKFWETSRVNMLMTEKEFLNGVLPVSEYARLSSIVYKAEEDYEQAKSEFQNSYMILEEIVHFKLNIYSPNP